MGYLKEFRDFALRGNVIDMAVGVIIGGAFSRIVTSVVNDVLMPPLGKAMSLGGKAMNFRDHYLRLFDDKDFQNAIAEKKLPANVRMDELTLDQIQQANLPALTYGAFAASVIDFLILAACVFVMVKIMNTVFRRQEAAAPSPPPQEKLLAEIRDLLKARSQP